MKNIKFYLALLSAVLFFGCEDVVDVDLNTAPPKLVIEAAIKWYKNTPGNNQTIRLSTTTNYYATKIPIVSGATIFIKNSTNTLFNFTEIPETGNYVCTNFVPLLNETYILTVIHKGSTYTANEVLQAVAPITEIRQNNQGGFGGQDIEIKAFYNDPENEINYYLNNYAYRDQVKLDFYVDEDTFYNGNPFFSISQNEAIKKDDKIEITHFGISKSYYNYMSILVSLAGLSGGGPFQSPPATVKGNIINTTNPANTALGYFSLSEATTLNYTVK